MVTAMLAAALAIQPGPSISFDQPAQPLARLVGPLGQAVGQSLSVSNLLVNEVVLVRVKDASPDDVLAKLAEAVGGKWVDVSGGKRLDLDTSLDAKERAVALKERTEQFKNEIEQLSAQLKQQPNFDPEALRKQAEDMRRQFEAAQQGGGQPGANPGMRAGMQRAGQMMAMLPGGRAIVQTLSSMRAEDLARIGPGTRVVFSSMPTPMQKPLPGGAANVMRSFLKDQATMVAQGGGMGMRRPGPPNGGPGDTSAPDVAQEAAKDAAARLRNAQPAKSFLIATRFGNGDGLNLQYIVADAQGQTLGAGNLTLGMDRFMRRFGQPDQPAQASKRETPLKLSDMGKAAAQAFSRGRGMRMAFFSGDNVMVAGGPEEEGPNPSAALVKAMTDPVANEPLGTVPSEILTLAAQGGNVVAYLPDSALQAAAQTAAGNPTPSQVLAAANSSWDVDAKATEGWLTVWPKRRFEARDSRVDRNALKAFIAAARSRNGAHLDDVARYATRSPYESSGLDTAVVRLVEPAAAQSLGEVYGLNRDMYLIWAGMGSGARTAALNGSRMPVSNLAATAMRLLGDMVYNSPDGPQVQRSGSQAADGQPVTVTAPGVAIPVGATPQQAPVQVEFSVAASARQNRQRGGWQNGRGGRGQFFGGNSDMTTERTEVLPRGVPGDSFVQVVTSREAVAKAVRNDSNLARVYSAQSMAAEEAFRDLPQGQNPRGGRPTIAWQGYVPGTETSYLFQFNLAPGITLTRVLSDATFDETGKVSSVSALPQGFQELYKAALLEMQQRRQEMAQRQQQGGGRTRRGNGQRPPGP